MFRNGWSGILSEELGAFYFQRNSAIVRAMTHLTSGQLYLRLLRYVAPYWQAFAVSVLTLIVVAATEAALPALMKPLLDGTFVERDPVLIRLVPVLIILLFLVRGVATFAGSYTSNWVGNKVVMDLRNEMFGKILHLPNQHPLSKGHNWSAKKDRSESTLCLD